MSFFRKSDLFLSKPAAPQARMPDPLQKEHATAFPASATRSPPPPASAKAPRTVHRPLMDLSTAQFSSNVGSFAPDNKDKPGSAPAFEDKVWVRVKSPDREDWKALLSIKIEVKPAGGHSKELVISVELTDEKDPFFFFHMECTETDFLSLKSEQNLLVDFQQFPSMLVELLGHCQPAGGKMNVTSVDDPAGNDRYGCLLFVGYAAEATFNFIETNQFKQLTHLSLRFRTGDDEVLKQYLAKTLKTYKAESESLAAKLESTEDALNMQVNANEKLKADLKIEHDENRKLEESLRLETQKQLNDLKEQMLSDMAAAGEKHSSEKERSRAAYESQLADLNSKLEDLRSQNADLSDRRMKLEASERELTTKVERMEQTTKMQESELASLRGTNRGLDTTKYTQEKELIELKVRCETMERQLEDKDQLVKKTTGLYEANRAQSSQLEETIGILKANAAKMEEKLKQGAQEINKGNEIIKQLQAETKAQKQKCKLKEGVITQQEQLIEQNRKSVEELTRTINDVKRDMGYKDEEVRLGKSKVEELGKKLEESQKLLASNDQSMVFRSYAR